MPWCEECAKYLAPSAMNIDGSCPSCNRPIATTNINGSINSDNHDLKSLARGSNDEDVSVPWHFKLLVGALVLYLTWRLIDVFR
jgi:hypothetical protein